MARPPLPLPDIPTAPIGAAGLIAGFAVAVGTGSRPLGGLVMLCFALVCMALWRRRDGTRTMWKLTGVGFAAFVVSHGLGLLIGAWPSVIVCAAGAALAAERLSDSGWRAARRAVAA